MVELLVIICVSYIHPCKLMSIYTYLYIVDLYLFGFFLSLFADSKSTFPTPETIPYLYFQKVGVGLLLHLMYMYLRCKRVLSPLVQG